MTIPKTVYFFWEGEVPLLVQIGIQSFIDDNPTWDVVFLNEQILSERYNIRFPTSEYKYCVQHRSDYYRLELLLAHGGVWMDASSISCGPITDWVIVDDPRVQGFHAHWSVSTLENWAIASPKGHPFVQRWLQMFKEAIHMGFPAFKEKHFYRLLEHPILLGSLPYLTQHACFILSQPLQKEVLLHYPTPLDFDASWFVEWFAQPYAHARRQEQFHKLRIERGTRPFLKITGANRKHYNSIVAQHPNRYPALDSADYPRHSFKEGVTYEEKCSCQKIKTRYRRLQEYGLFLVSLALLFYAHNLLMSPRKATSTL